MRRRGYVSFSEYANVLEIALPYVDQDSDATPIDVGLNLSDSWAVDEMLLH